MLEFRGMRSTPLLSSFPGPLWFGAVAPDRVLSMGQIEINSLIMLNWIVEIELLICIKTDLALFIFYNGWYLIEPNQTRPLVMQNPVVQVTS